MIDSHHHLWHYSKEDYPWIPEGSPLAQDQLVQELETVTSAAGVTGTVVVQARQVFEESVSYSPSRIKRLASNPLSAGCR